MKWITILCFLISYTIKSQVLSTYNIIASNDSTTNLFIANVQYCLQSNSLSKNFVKNIRTNQYISKKIKDTNPLHDPFLALYDWINEVHVFIKPDTLFGIDNLGIHASINYHQFSSVKTSEDAIRLIMYGNKNFAGKNVNFDQTKINFFNYGTATLGLTRTIKNNPTFDIHALLDINFHIFKEIQSLNISKGNVYTADDGTYIHMGLKGIYQASKQYQPGLSFNMSLRWIIKPIKTEFSFYSYQLGFTRLGKNSQYAHIDTSITFEGIEIQNILSTPTISNGLLQNDSIKQYFQSFIDSNISYLRLPEIVKFSISKHWQHPLLSSTNFGTMYIFHTEQPLPEFFVSQTFSIYPTFSISTGCTFSGFSLINPFVSFRFKKNQWSISGYLSNPLSFILPNSPYNSIFQCSFSKLF